MYAATIKDDASTTVAVKKLSRSAIRTNMSTISGLACKEDAMAEIAIMRQLEEAGGHPNLLKLVDCFEEDDDNVYIVTELC